MSVPPGDNRVGDSIDVLYAWMFVIWLLVWIGFEFSQSFSVVKFDTLAECEAARSAVISAEMNFADEWPRCVSYEWVVE